MQLKKWIQTILISGSVLALTACTTHRNTDQTDVAGANSAYGADGAQSSGAGDETRFGDQANGNRSGRVYYFAYDSNVVNDSDKPAIGANADYLVAHPHAKVMLEGNTDPRGSREYNIGLGERRAQAVAEILAQKGVNPKQIRIVSYGAEKLASAGRTESDYQKDRRVVLVYLQR